MNAIKNTVRLIGHVGTTPVIKELSGNTKQASLSLITTESYKNASGNKVSDKQWHFLIAVGRTAELIQKQVSQGCEIAIEGKLLTRNYINSNNVKVHKSEIHLREILILRRTPCEIK